MCTLIITWRAINAARRGEVSGVWRKLIPAEPEQPARCSHLKAQTPTVIGAANGIVRPYTYHDLFWAERSHHPKQSADFFHAGDQLSGRHQEQRRPRPHVSRTAYAACPRKGRSVIFSTSAKIRLASR